jgi:hypothetical protein
MGTRPARLALAFDRMVLPVRPRCCRCPDADVPLTHPCTSLHDSSGMEIALPLAGAFPQREVLCTVLAADRPGAWIAPSSGHCHP